MSNDDHSRSGRGRSRRAIGLRADLDALHIHECSGVEHASRNEGRMHACGHDGHTAMLLAAAQALAKRRRFDGTAYFIFQPAEENEGGGRVMVEEGLFERFPMRAVYGLHNFPKMKPGTFAMREGPFMGAYDIFEIVATGKGAHAARAAEAVVGAASVDRDPTPEMATEDFVFMLKAEPGCYLWLGSGAGEDPPGLHNPRYDFNDEVLAIGASYWVTLAEQQLPPRG